MVSSPYLLHRRKAFRGGWTPAAITTALWLDSSDNATLFNATSGGSLPAGDGAVFRWEDKSGNAFHATNGTSTQQPIRKVSAQNSLDVLEFDGSNDRLTVSDNATLQFGTGDFSVFSVGSVVNPSKGGAAQHTIISKDFTGFEASIYQGSLAGWVGSTASTLVAGITANAYNILSSTRISGSVDVRRNGGTATTTTASGNASASGLNVTVGNRTGNTSAGLMYGQGRIAEIILLPASSTNATNRQLIEGYLAHKWGLTGDLPGDHPYKSVAP